MERIPRRRRVRMTRQAISPRFATSTVLNTGTLPAPWVAPVLAVAGSVVVCMVIAGSHPEEAEGGLRQGAAGDDVKRQAQDGARIGRIDDGVIPQPRGGVVRA